MAIKEFYLVGQAPKSARHLDIGTSKNLADVYAGVAAQYDILSEKGISFHDGNKEIKTLETLLTSDTVGVMIDGHEVRDPQGAPGLPVFGNHFELYPDHLGNAQRLFAKYGSVIKTDNMGRITYLTNDPEVARFVFREGDYFTKAPSDPNHPLYGIRDQTALFLCDTDSPAWKEGHKFVPPSMSPKAVRHYTPILQKAVEGAFKVFDEFDERGDAFNVFRYTAKLAAEVIVKLVLGVDLHNFDTVDTPMNRLIVLLQKYLELNRRVQTRGTWYSYLPFGDPVELQKVRKELYGRIEKAVQDCELGGTENLPINEAALKASCIVDYLVRATDDKGRKLDREYILSNTLALFGAGFVTSSAFLAWLIYALVAYPGNQERLLQELIDAGAAPDKKWTYDEIQELPFLDMFIKETQRLHSPSFQPARNCKKDVVLPGGYHLPRGAIIIPTMPHMHRHSAYWDNPERFIPDRWTTDSVKSRHKSLYVPFAQGQRGCIGFNVALQEVKLAIAELVFRYQFFDASTEAIEYDPEFIVIRPCNLYVRAVRRTSWPQKSAPKVNGHMNGHINGHKDGHMKGEANGVA